MTDSKRTILVVDDDYESLKLLISILEEEGYQVRAADSGKLALASAAAESPELILLDIRMPGMDGLEVFRCLKDSEHTREIQVMFLSASAEQEERVEGLAMGAVDFVSKPFHREELLARVRTHLELGRLRTQLEVQVARRNGRPARRRRTVATRSCRAQTGRSGSARKRRALPEHGGHIPGNDLGFWPRQALHFLQSEMADFYGQHHGPGAWRRLVLEGASR